MPFPFFRAALALMALGLPGVIPTGAQAMPARILFLPAPQGVQKPSGRAKSRVINVVVVAIQGTVVQFRTEEKDLPLVNATITEKTKWSRVTAGAVKPGVTPGESLVARLAFYPDGRVLISELWEPAKYAELQRLRKEVLVGKVVMPLPGNATSGWLAIQPEDEEAIIEYRVTDKTVFYLKDTVVPPRVYTEGAAVAIKPRALPSGGFMASIVAESEKALEIAYRDTLTRWEGVVERVDPPNFYLVLKRSDGAVRRVIFPRELTLTDEKTRKEKGERRLYALAELEGRPVIVRLVRGERPGEHGTRTAVEITVGTDSKASGASAVTEQKATETKKP